MSSTTESVIGMRIWQALQLVKSNKVWIGIGKTTPWPNEDAPPAISGNEKALEELVALKKAEKVMLVVPDENGDIEVNKLMFKQVTEAEARQKNVRWVYVSTWVKYDEVPSVRYRQTGVFSDVTLKAATPPGKLVVTSSEINDIGYLLAMNNRKAIPHDIDTKELLEFIVEY